MMELPEPTADVPTLDRLEDLLKQLGPDSAPRWGVMGPAEMVAHCVAFVDLCRGRTRVSWPLRILARLLGPRFLRRLLSRSVEEAPREMSTLRSLRTAGSGGELAAALDALAERWQALRSLSAEHRHPLYGPMRQEDVHALVRHHTAHHADHFGLLAAR